MKTMKMIYQNKAKEMKATLRYSTTSNKIRKVIWFASFNFHFTYLRTVFLFLCSTVAVVNFLERDIKSEHDVYGFLGCFVPFFLFKLGFFFVLNEFSVFLALCACSKGGIGFLVYLTPLALELSTLFIRRIGFLFMCDNFLFFFGATRCEEKRVVKKGRRKIRQNAMVLLCGAT